MIFYLHFDQLFFSVQDTDQNPSKVTIEKLTSSTEFTCTKGDETASASVDLISK